MLNQHSTCAMPSFELRPELMTESGDASPLCSVVMCVFNGERFLSEAIESILCQAFEGFEFIIVDDGSTDGTAEIIDRYQRGEPRIRLLRHQKNEGLVSAQNNGFRLARGKYIALMAADDVAVKDRLIWQIDFMEKHPEVGVLGGSTEWIDSDGRALLTKRYPIEDREIRTELATSCPFSAPSVLIRKEIFFAAGGFRKPFLSAEDYDLWLRAAEHCVLANLPQVLLRYRIHPNQESHRSIRQMTLCLLAAQASAVARRNGVPDPLNSFDEITPQVLSALGLGEGACQRALVTQYRGAIGKMSRTGKYSAGLELAGEMLHSSDWRHVDRWELADVWLESAWLHWQRKEFLRSVIAGGHALLIRPAAAGRPLKNLKRRIWPDLKPPRD
jgi:GT2 family glycosyltransferase